MMTPEDVDALANILSRLRTAEAENARLTEALEWYAAMDDINNYVALAALSVAEPERKRVGE